MSSPPPDPRTPDNSTAAPRWDSPWTESQRDAHIEVLRMAWFELAQTLHEQGLLDMQRIVESMAEAAPLLHRRPHLQALWASYADTLADNRLRAGPPGQDAA